MRGLGEEVVWTIFDQVIEKTLVILNVTSVKAQEEIEDVSVTFSLPVPL